ncbi:MAG: RidA family protein [Runella slithyformis]|nr:MAG: RidA family protein [Runella slithyformis]TAF97718.1 MAG: RidA family protein [Runella sp.]TAG22714.1 MAG: RidA family protein [Cytophagales bacterium]TAG41818.1 MAG: RidA family protein [Cytophagia bacterium]TAF81519.1 MAG: RidA family protein [Runella slithyformis]
MLRSLLFSALLCVSTLALAQKKIISTPNAPVPIAPYSQAVEAGGLVFVAGQIGLDPATRQLVAGGIEAETTRTMANVKAILAAAGLGMDDIVNTTIYLKDLAHFQKVNELYGAYFTGNFPARTTVGVANLPGGASIEIAVVAAQRPRRK